MKHDAKFNLACEIMQQMIARYTQVSGMQQSLTLQVLREEEKALLHCDANVIDKIINTYGPLVCVTPKLSQLAIRPENLDQCLKCSGCKKFSDFEVTR